MLRGGETPKRAYKWRIFSIGWENSKGNWECRRSNEQRGRALAKGILGDGVRELPGGTDLEK